MKPIDQAAQECAEKTVAAVASGCITQLQRHRFIIAAAMREVCEPLEKRCAERREVAQAILIERDQLRHENNCLLVRLNAETDVIKAERDQLRARVAELEAYLEKSRDEANGWHRDWERAAETAKRLVRERNARLDAAKGQP